MSKRKLPRVDELTGPPAIGQFYLVSTVRGEWYGIEADWPVQGEMHEDRKFFAFPWRHYHLDRRFIAPRFMEPAVAMPLAITDRINPGGLPDPVWRRRRCTAWDQWFPTDRPPVEAMQDALAGTRCRRDATGWVCPHRNLPLGAVVPDAHGIIRCPMHGLRIDAETGVVPDSVELRRRCLTPEDVAQQEHAERLFAQFDRVDAAP